MAEPHIKARASECGNYMLIEMDRAGADYFDRLIERAQPRPNDSPVNFRSIKDRVRGAFLAGKSVMGWLK